MAPLLARAGGSAELDRPAGLLLGADLDVTYPVVSVQLRGDDLVLFYTDGLVERRAGNTDELLRRVSRTLSDVSVRPDDGTLARLRGLLHSPNPDDDTCTLVVRVLP
jgi:serine phosphatase RsbU (regulator of sigma subunit)